MEVSSVLFAAGRGKRLRPLTDRVPKPALPVLDVPLAAWGLAALSRHAPPVVVNASYLAHKVISALEATGLPGWEPFVEGADAFGTAGTLRALRDRLGPRIVTWNADALTDLHLPDLLEAHERGGAPATLLVREVGSLADLELVDTPHSRDRTGPGDSVASGSPHPRDRTRPEDPVASSGPPHSRDRTRAEDPVAAVAGFIDRRSQPDAAGARFLGIAVFEREVLERLPDGRPAGLGETLLRELAGTGDLSAHLFDGYLRDVGTPAEYLQVSLDVLNGSAPAPPIDLPGEIISVEGGRAYVGPGADVDPSRLGPGAIVLAGAKMDATQRVQNEIVWRDGEPDDLNG